MNIEWELSQFNLPRPDDGFDVWSQKITDAIIKELGLRIHNPEPKKRDTGFGIFTVRTARMDGSEMHQPMLTFDDSAISFRTQTQRHEMWKRWIRENPI